jgi:hypothetical protein
MTVRHEALVLVGLVVAVDAVFIGVYFLAGVARTGDAAKVAFTVAWTAITLLIVLRGLTRIRSIRAHRGRDSSS